jgi:tetratricopeptide (TPR) repeat protein
MTTRQNALPEPPALTALRDYPLLLDVVETSMMQQTSLIQTAARRLVGRHTTLVQLEHLLQSLGGGVVTVEAPPGGGVSSVLAYLANTRPCAFWFTDADARQGAAALAAQLIALQRLPIPLIPPAVQSNPTIPERFLAETRAHKTSEGTLCIIIDAAGSTAQPVKPFPIGLTRTLPPDVLIIYGCEPGTPLPVVPAARLRLPQTNEAARQDQTRLLQAANCPGAWIDPLLNTAQGNVLYLRLAHGMLAHELIAPHELPADLAALHRVWWESLDATGQRLALLLAAAGEALPLEVCDAFLRDTPRPYLMRWEQIGLVHPNNDTVSFAHWYSNDVLAQQQPDALAQVHDELVVLALHALEINKAPALSMHMASPAIKSNEAQTYLLRQFARHAALGTRDKQINALPLVAQREWVRRQERRTGALGDAAHDLAWELSVAARLGPADRLARSAALAGTLVSRARTLSPDAAVAALPQAIDTFGREGGLKQLRALVDQLPDGQEKALILRRLGEACYGLRMRTAAMRLLSQALDIEEHKVPVAWREQREHLHSQLANAALMLGEFEVALHISHRIQHIERRGAVETQVVRWLLNNNELDRARDVARNIDHESLGAWALAEVAVTIARVGDLAAGEALLGEVFSPTAAAWGQIELACDAAATDETSARRRIDRLDSPNQRDRGLARLAHALARANKDGDALDAAGQIGDVATRVSALLDLRLQLEGLVAMLALEQVTAVIGSLQRDVRVPLVSMLAAAYASLGRRDEALRVADQLAEGEERDRAHSRVAVALGERGELAEALELARALEDEDERDWTLDELARTQAEAGHWQAARDLSGEIVSEQQRARTLADLAIAYTRAGDLDGALEVLRQVPSFSEYSRALMIIAPLLVERGSTSEALELVQATHAQAPFELEPAQASRHLAAIASVLAKQKELDQARELTPFIARPLDRARAHLAIAQAAARKQRKAAFVELGTALSAALIGHDETFQLLQQAATIFALLGGAQLLQSIAAAVDEVDAL